MLFLFQKLGFIRNWEKSVFQPSQEMEFLGMIINSQTLCQDPKTGKLQATLPAISIAPMQILALQQDLIERQHPNMKYGEEIKLSVEL